MDHRADIYSLGVVFYEMLTGELPIGRFEPPSKKVQIDVRLDDVVLRSLESKPERRYQNASDVKSDVEQIREDGDRGQVSDIGPSSAERSSDIVAELLLSAGALVSASLRSLAYTFGLFFIAWAAFGWLFELRTPGVVIGAILVGAAGYFALQRTRQKFSMLKPLRVHIVIRILCVLIVVVLFDFGMKLLGRSIDARWDRSTPRYKSSQLVNRKARSWAEDQMPDLLSQLKPDLLKPFETDENKPLKPRLMSMEHSDTFLFGRGERDDSDLYVVSLLSFALATGAAGLSLRLPGHLIIPSMLIVPVLGWGGLAANRLLTNSGDFASIDEYKMEERIETRVIPAKLDQVRENLEASLAREGYRLHLKLGHEASVPFTDSEGITRHRLIATVFVLEAEPESIFDRWRFRTQERVMPHLLIVLVAVKDQCIIRINMGRLREDTTSRWPGSPYGWQQWCQQRIMSPLLHEAKKAKTQSDGKADDSASRDG